MSIPASRIVEVNPRISSAGGDDLEISGLLLTESELIPLGAPAVKFSGPEEAADYFGTNSDEYEFASVYFGGYDDSFSKPKTLTVARRVKKTVKGWMRGGRVSLTPAALSSVTDGAVSIEIDGEKIDVTGADFSGASSLSAAADILSAKLNAAKAGSSVTYSSVTGSFTITGAAEGAGGSVSYASAPASGTDLSELLGLTKERGAVLSPGAEPAGVDSDLAAVRRVTDNWVTFTTIYPADTEEMTEYARWADSMGVNYLYVGWSADESLTVKGAEGPEKALEEAGASAAALVYGGYEYAAFIMGIAASIDWNRTAGTVNFAFKSKSGLAPSVTDASAASVLTDKKINFYGSYATRNDSFVFLYDGSMFGSYGFIDPFVNAVWLNNAIQASVMRGLSASGRVPYTEEGYTLVRSWLADPVERALNNGVIEPGVRLSESQKAELVREAGFDISSELDTLGYYIQVKDPGAQARTTRESPSVSLWYSYGGGVNRVVIASTAIV